MLWEGRCAWKGDVLVEEGAMDDAKKIELTARALVDDVGGHFGLCSCHKQACKEIFVLIEL